MQTPASAPPTVLLAGLLLLPLTPLAPPTALAEEPPLQRIIDQARLDAGAPGAILGVLGPEGDPVIVASGSNDIAGKIPLQADQPFFLGSIAKTYTAALILRLADLRRLRLDDPLSQHIPDFPRASEITLRQLLAHTSGLQDFYSYLYFRPDRAETVWVSCGWSGRVAG